MLCYTGASEKIMLPSLNTTKFGFRIRTPQGLVVEHVMIHGRDEADAERKLRQMYLNCEVLERSVMRPAAKGSGARRGASARARAPSEYFRARAPPSGPSSRSRLGSRPARRRKSPRETAPPAPGSNRSAPGTSPPSPHPAPA